MSEETIFAAALDLPAAERAAYLAKACGRDAALRRRLEGLLTASDRAGAFMARPAVEEGTQLVDSNSTPNDATITKAGPAPAAADDDEVPLGFLAPPTRPDSLGRIGHYEVLQVLGQGGFGIVFRAFDDVLQRVVAVKVLAPQLAATSPARKRFLREARSSAQVRHENVVQVYEVGETPLPYIAMEFIPGETLQQRLNRMGPVDAAEVVRVGRQVAEGLAAAHATDLIHRDIKPGNVLLESGPQQRVKITDFGLARAADDASISQSGIIAGTPMYMAPEQALGHKLDQRADLFSLGSMLYQMAAGRAPFRANGTVAVLKRVAEDTPRDIREIIPETPQWLCDIVAKLHAKNPDERFRSARQVADVLADCEAQLKTHSKLKDYSRIPRSGRPARAGAGKWKWVAAAVLLLPLIALAVTEFAGVTHLFRGQQATNDPIKPGDEPQAKATPSWHGWPADAPPPAIAPFGLAKAKELQVTWAKHLGVPVEFSNSIGMKFVIIPPGQSTMGSTQDEIDLRVKQMRAHRWVMDRLPGEGPQHEVEITQPFCMGQTEVTVGQFRKFVKATGYKTQAEGEAGALRNFPNWETRMEPDTNWLNPGFAQTDDHPVVCVSWNDAMEFCNWLSNQEGKKYRLPTEAEWEYSCRAGSKSRWSFGDNERVLSNYARFNNNSQFHSWPVAGLKENAWGLYDTHGNVWEWCQDAYDADYYKTSPPKDPPGPGTGGARVQRGGSWYDEPVVCCSVFRSHEALSFRYDNSGFRVMVAVAPPAGVRIESGAKDKPSPLPPNYTNGLGMEFVKVPKGKSWLGGGKDKLGDKEVEIPADFYLGKYEVTQEEWEKVMGENPSHFSRTGGGKNAVKDVSDADLKRFPVEYVSWDQCQVFVAKLNKLEKESGWVYRLPTEVEWEYACRGGPMTDKLDSAFDFYFATPTNNLLPGQANCNQALDRSCKVGSYQPNRLGLFDMHGNLFEWCEEAKNGADESARRAARGGGWYWQNSMPGRAGHSSERSRSDRVHTLGLRLARVPFGAPSPEAKKPPAAIAPFTAADVARIAALPAAEQVEEVRKELVRRNPGFDGKVEHKIKDGVVTEIKLVTDNVTDVAPIRVFNALRVLDCSGAHTTDWHGNGQLDDLTPLKGMNLAGLTVLRLQYTKVGNAGMSGFKNCKKLLSLALAETNVTDVGLENFKESKGLTHLWISDTKVGDVGLAYFKDCKGLKALDLNHLKLTDAGLANFKDCKDLTHLSLYETSVSDVGLAYFKDCKALTRLNIVGTKITDLSLIKGMPLKELSCDFQPERDAEILRSMKTLETINGRPAAEFWKDAERE
ncbi:MAG TPA: SUMF1/EgtB/PvdO family nonheme iron enzyme [Gemmataceae bacterium]|nr:SUMF1/EgtB/PvdO family nonheme iron enzyme [Gemmataceae bacterium]